MYDDSTFADDDDAVLNDTDDTSKRPALKEK